MKPLDRCAQNASRLLETKGMAAKVTCSLVGNVLQALRSLVIVLRRRGATLPLNRDE
jgi:hypothetical protein